VPKRGQLEPLLILLINKQQKIHPVDSGYGQINNNTMAITKELKTDKIEVVGDWTIQVRTATIIKEDGVELTRSFSRHALQPFSSFELDDASWTHTDTDLSGEDVKVQAIANAVWTDDVKNAFKAWKESSSI
tara:strand:- start:105 stop:500 length:396 start_codon:yes stop_codon:yes gene_type:complete